MSGDEPRPAGRGYLRDACIATLYAWVAGLVILLLGGAWRMDLLVVVLWATGLGVFVVVSCLILVAPLLRLVPGYSVLWRPGMAALFGAVAGPIVFTLELLPFGGLDFGSGTSMLLGCAAVVGATFGFVLAGLRWPYTIGREA